MEEAVIRSKIEIVELPTQISAKTAKINMLTMVTEPQGEAVHDYYDANMEDNVDPTFTDTSTAEFAPVVTAPKTPESS